MSYPHCRLAPPFKAGRRNSTQLDVELSCFAINGPSGHLCLFVTDVYLPRLQQSTTRCYFWSRVPIFSLFVVARLQQSGHSCLSAQIGVDSRITPIHLRQTRENNHIIGTKTAAKYCWVAPPSDQWRGVLCTRYGSKRDCVKTHPINTITLVNTRHRTTTTVMWGLHWRLLINSVLRAAGQSICLSVSLVLPSLRDIGALSRRCLSGMLRAAAPRTPPDQYAKYG